MIVELNLMEDFLYIIYDLFLMLLEEELKIVLSLDLLFVEEAFEEVIEEELFVLVVEGFVLLEKLKLLVADRQVL
jgi:hypothetical protein